MKTLKFIFMFLIVSSFFSACKQQNKPTEKKQLKYVFLLIGDGMGINQALITNQYCTFTGNDNLSFTNFRNIALTSTHCKDSLKITDSAASGTAIATGRKTQFQTIGMDTVTGELFTSIAETAKNNNWKVGIVSSVGLNHATPAAFYAKQKSRHDYIKIAEQIKNSNFDLFAGGGILTQNDTAEQNRLLKEIENAGYNLISEKTSYSPAENYGKKVFYSIKSMLDKNEDFRYSIDCKTSPTLADFTDFSTRYLMNDTGFFLMVESGKIDWACHANDAATAINEVIAFDKAVKVALDFYEKHPDETLIIITADHETGGISWGTNDKKYDIDFEKLSNQKISAQKLTEKLTQTKPKQMPDTVKKYIDLEFTKNYFENKTPKNIVASLIDSINTSAGIGWSSHSHTGMPVATYAKGIGSENFNGIIDNTDISKIILKTANMSFSEK